MAEDSVTIARLDTGVTVKLYPSCAATHPPLDALLGLEALWSPAFAVAALVVGVIGGIGNLAVRRRGAATGIAQPGG